MTPHRERGTLRGHYDYDAERDEMPDPHYAEEIDMLQRSLANLSGLSAIGIENSRARLADLQRFAPHFDGRRMIGDEPCRCLRCARYRDEQMERNF